MALVLALSACGGDAPDAPSATVRDSAGVRIVENRPGAWPPAEAWTLSEAPLVNIGASADDPDDQLFAVRGAIGLPDGGTLIGEFGSRLRYFDRRGAHVRTLERQGQGPGEAEAFSELRRYRGDSIALTTLQGSGREILTHLLILDSGGSYGRDVEISIPGRGDNDPTTVWIGRNEGGLQAALPDGSFLLEGAVRVRLDQAVDGVLTGRSGIIRVDPSGSSPDTLITVPAAFYEDRRGAFGPYELMLDESRPLPVRSHGMRFFRSTGERFVIDVYAAGPLESDPASAPLVASYRIDAPLRPSTPASREAHIARVVEIYTGGDPPERQAEYRERLESLRSPDSLPAVQDLLVDALGNLWLEEYRSPGPESRERAWARGLPGESEPSGWIVLDPDGRLIGRVLVPARFSVHEIGADYVLGLWYDELGVEHVRRYGLEKERPQR